MPFCCLAVQLLGRVFNILRENNPELAGDRRRTVMRPPQVLREGTKKTVFVNFMDLCKTYVFISHITMHYSYQIFIIYNYRLFALQIFFIHCFVLFNSTSKFIWLFYHMRYVNWTLVCCMLAIYSLMWSLVLFCLYIHPKKSYLSVYSGFIYFLLDFLNAPRHKSTGMLGSYVDFVPQNLPCDLYIVVRESLGCYCIKHILC